MLRLVGPSGNHFISKLDSLRPLVGLAEAYTKPLISCTDLNRPSIPVTVGIRCAETTRKALVMQLVCSSFWASSTPAIVFGQLNASSNDKSGVRVNSDI